MSIIRFISVDHESELFYQLAKEYGEKGEKELTAPSPFPIKPYGIKDMKIYTVNLPKQDISKHFTFRYRDYYEFIKSGYTNQQQYVYREYLNFATLTEYDFKWISEFTISRLESAPKEAAQLVVTLKNDATLVVKLPQKTK